MQVLVIGGAGFIGSHVVDRLMERGVGVRIFDQVRSPYHEDVDHSLGSILDVHALRHAMNGVVAAIHLAAVADVKDVFEDPVYAEEVNTRGTLCVLEAARRAMLPRVIYGSTTWVYSDSEAAVVDEDTPLGAPSHLYTATKIASEHYCRAYSKLYGLDFTILRFGIPYGPRARDGAVIPIFVERALSGRPLTIAGDGLQFRKFIYVEDLAAGVVLSLKGVARNRIYNLDGVEQVSIRQIAETIQRLVDDVRIEHIEARPGDFSGKEVSSRLAKEELGWEPKVSFEEGVRRYVEWFRDRKQARQDAWERVDALLKG